MINDDDNMARILLKNDAEIQKTTEDGNMLLHAAAKTGSTFPTRFLLAREVNPNKRNNSQETPLQIASITEHRNIAHLLLANKTTEISAIDTTGQTPLHCAATSDHFAIVQELITKGAAIDTLDNQMRTPLYAAMQNNHTRISHYLKSHGAKHPKNFPPDFPLDLPPYEPTSDISRLRSKQGKSVSPEGNKAAGALKSESAGPQKTDSAEDPFEASIPKPALPPDPVNTVTVIRQEAGTDAVKAGVDVANAGLNLMGTLLAG